MKRIWCVGIMFSFCFVCLFYFSWKIWTLFTLEVEVYSRVEAQWRANGRLVSRCKAFEKHRQLKLLDTNTREGIHKKCEAGSVLKDGDCTPCPKGMFSLPGWMSCDNYLSCEQIRYDVRVTKDMFTAGEWLFKSAEWRGHQVLLAEENKGALLTEGDQKIINRATQNSVSLKPIGYCLQRGSIVFAPLSEVKGTADELDSILAHSSKCDNWIVRFRLAIDFVQILAQLHSAENGPIVFCNSHSLDQTLKQFAVTEHWELFLASFSNLPQRKDGSLIKCSDTELRGDFVAPEQKWPYAGTKVFNIHLQPGYSEASDVWKIPDITKAFLGSSQGARRVLEYLSLTHFRCKSTLSDSRPNVTSVLNHYKDLWNLLVYYY